MILKRALSKPMFYIKTLGQFELKVRGWQIYSVFDGVGQTQCFSNIILHYDTKMGCISLIAKNMNQ
jgi:hypothetical protein